MVRAVASSRLPAVEAHTLQGMGGRGYPTRLGATTGVWIAEN
jgi:hypothetical protein